MKVSISLPARDVEFVDQQAEAGLFQSRSEAIHAAIGLLRDRQYTDSYAAAWDEWDESGDASLWDVGTSDGVR